MLIILKKFVFFFAASQLSAGKTQSKISSFFSWMLLGLRYWINISIFFYICDAWRDLCRRVIKKNELTDLKINELNETDVYMHFSINSLHEINKWLLYFNLMVFYNFFFFFSFKCLIFRWKNSLWFLVIWQLSSLYHEVAL